MKSFFRYLRSLRRLFVAALEGRSMVEPEFKLAECGCHKICLTCGWSVPVRSLHDPDDCASNLDEESDGDYWF